MTLTQGDDFPIHQTPEPVAFVTDRNFYDRYFFNGYSSDGSIFFSAAMGIYPALDVIDAAFCVIIDDCQHNLRASARLNSERMNLKVGPIEISIEIPLQRLRIRVIQNDSPLTADLLFEGRHAPIEEPRFTRRNGSRLFMDYTRLTQNGKWSGHFSFNGHTHELDFDCVGTRDRSWGIRGVGRADSQPPPAGAVSQFYWLWTPSNFAQSSLFFHTNDDNYGKPWNRRAVHIPDGGQEYHWDNPHVEISYRGDTRRVSQITLTLDDSSKAILIPTKRNFYMNGLGYMHPDWGHGMDHGELDIAYDCLKFTEESDLDPKNLHIQAISEVIFFNNGQEIRGLGVIEQAFVGSHEPSGLTDINEPV